MKNLIKSLAALLLLISTCVFANNPRNSIVTKAEYKTASNFEKRVINQIDAAIAALDVLNENNANKDLDALVSISKNSADRFSNAIIISKKEPVALNMAEVLKGSCTVSGVRSAYKCLKEITADETLGDEFDVHVKRNEDGSVTISW